MDEHKEEWSVGKLLKHTEVLDDFVKEVNVFPINFEVSLTNACNFKCPHCSDLQYRSLDKASTIDKDVLTRFVKGAKELGLKAITLTGGGEPTLHPDFGGIVTNLMLKGVSTGLITNGTFLHKFNKLGSLQWLSYVRVSFDAATKDMYCKIHGVSEEIYHTVLSNLEEMISSREACWSSGSSYPKVIGVSYLVNKANIREASHAAMMFKSMGVDYIQFKPTIASDWTFEEVPQSYEILKRTQEDLEDNNFKIFIIRLDDNLYPGGKKDFKYCYAHRFVGNLSASGDVMLCCSIKQKYLNDFCFGNINDSSIKAIWESEKRMNIVATVEHDKLFVHNCCTPCRFNDYNMYLNMLRTRKDNPLWEFV